MDRSSKDKHQGLNSKILENFCGGNIPEIAPGIKINANSNDNANVNDNGKIKGNGNGKLNGNSNGNGNVNGINSKLDKNPPGLIKPINNEIGSAIGNGIQDKYGNYSNLPKNNNLNNQPNQSGGFQNCTNHQNGVQNNSNIQNGVQNRASPVPYNTPPSSNSPSNFTASKYLKICPAIAPKPILSNLPKISFDPTITKKKPVNDNLMTSLNTSKKWVLPPRPRPGRKPNNDELNMLKKKKVKKIDKKDPITTTNTNTNTNTTALPTPTTTPTMATATKSMLSNSTPSATTQKQPIDKSLNELKLNYLKKLKEQELIRNYIEIITNQINELSFVKNGIITFDALKTQDIKMWEKNVKKMDTLKNSDKDKLEEVIHKNQLESINNINDLNKFLNYSINCSNLLNSVTKKSSNDSKDKNFNHDTWLNNQINYYLDIRSKFKQDGRANSNAMLQNVNTNNRIDNSPIVVPELLKPLTRSFDDDYFDFSSNDDLIIEDQDFDNLILDANIEPFGDSLNYMNDDSEINGLVKIYDLQNFDDNETNSPATDISVKKKSKLNCGFCSNDTPCLCLDAEIEVCNIKK